MPDAFVWPLTVANSKQAWHLWMLKAMKIRSPEIHELFGHSNLFCYCQQNKLPRLPQSAPLFRIQPCYSSYSRGMNLYTYLYIHIYSYIIIYNHKYIHPHIYINIVHWYNDISIFLIPKFRFQSQSSRRTQISARSGILVYSTLFTMVGPTSFRERSPGSYKRNSGFISALGQA